MPPTNSASGKRKAAHPEAEETKHPCCAVGDNPMMNEQNILLNYIF